MDTFPERAPFILGPMFALAGWGHFALHDMFAGFTPPRGTWGFWNVPGSPSFHVNWTGVVEMALGVGLVVGALHPDFAPDNLMQLCGWGLALLTFAVTPANFYMWSHNAPGPLKVEQLDEAYGEGNPIPQPFHLVRGLMQVFLISTFIGIGQS